MKGQNDLLRLSHTIFLLLSLSASASFAQTNNSTQTVLQKHVSFFDRDGDGLVYPKETYQGFRAIGCSPAFSALAASIINLGLSGKTRPGQPVDLKFPIVIKNINLGKHGSDSGAYDEAGRFVPSKFEEIFAKHTHSNPNSLTWDELQEMLKANRIPKDTVGWIASYFEWKALYDLAKDENGLLQKDTLRAVFDGSLFEQLAKRKSQSGN